MTKGDVLALPEALRHFNGFYTVSGEFTMENGVHILIALAVVVIAVTMGLVWLAVRYRRRRRAGRSVQVPEDKGI